MSPKEIPAKVRKIQCPSCNSMSSIESAPVPNFCPVCGYRLALSSEDELSREASEIESSSVSLVHGHEPRKDTVQFSIGSYQVVKSIGKGGMGEVLLAYDTICGRRIALKRIRPDLLGLKQIQNRFLKEARVTSQLTHPSIIPIYSIHKDEQITYYTMPFVEGETLKQILRRARQQEHKREKSDQLEGSIPSLVRIYLSICQAVAYAHSKSVLHRDLKPENIIIGKYGEVMILDWGLAKLISSPEEGDLVTENEEIKPLPHITQMGKVVGTVAYMAPERGKGAPASKQTEIYSLGAILYQILTLHPPFLRGSLKEFREQMDKEVLQDPIEVAPYRDIPKVLSQVTLKCLSPKPEDRYQSVDELIHDIENYIEGRAEWFKIAELNPQNKDDWEFQEHILIAEHTAITRTAEISEWVQLMISKASFAQNIKFETKVFFDEKSHGLGFLFNIPEASEREQINDGYCLWLASDLSKNSKLLRSSVEVSYIPDVFLERGKWYDIRIEKIENSIRLLINREEVFSYISRMPLPGTHAGLLSRDTQYKMEPLKIYVSSQNIMVNCLAIPDAFLAHNEYHQALSEYRRIGYSFPGRAEGREAILRAGITLIEQAKNTPSKELSLSIYDAALEEFEKLHRTAGAPLEYLGKALVYEAQEDIEEEVKCFELALRRYNQHPLINTIHDQILFRLMESSRTDRKAAYHFLLLTLCHLPKLLEIPAVHKLMFSLQRHWEPLDFFASAKKDDKEEMIITVAFWAHKNYVLEEIIEELWNKELPSHTSLMNAFLSLIVLNESGHVHKLLSHMPKSGFTHEKKILNALLEPDLEKGLKALTSLSFSEYDPSSFLSILCDRALDEGKTDIVYKALEEIKKPLDQRLLERKIWALLWDRKWELAGKEFEKIPLDQLTHESSLLHYLYGMWLYVTESPEIAQIHWSSVLDVPFPRTWSLASHYLIGKLEPGWFKRAFDWERWQLQRQLRLFERKI